MTDFLDEKRDEIAVRLRELKPLVDEYTRLQAAAAALEGMDSTPAQRRDATPGAREAGPRQRDKHSPARRGRPRGSGMRATEALQLIKANPGIAIAEIAEQMGIKQNYLYRVLPGLADDGLVTKQGRGWYPNQTDTTSSDTTA